MTPRSIVLCPRCGCRRFAGRGRVHDSGDCTRRRYLVKRGVLPKREQRGRPPNAALRAADWDWTPEQIEAIMRRRAREQRYERAMQQ